MKQQAIQYLAFDVHQATVVGVARDERGSIMLRAAIPTEARAILQLVKSAGPRVHVAFEEGTQAQWLHDLLVPHAEKVIVCNTHGRAESGKQVIAGSLEIVTEGSKETPKMSPRRKTVPPTRVSSRSSQPGRSELIAREKNEKQSAKERNALHNRFHRTHRPRGRFRVPAYLATCTR